MYSEDVKKIKCDRCNAVIGLYQHNEGWRCPSCIWREREDLIERAKDVLNGGNYYYCSSNTIKVYRDNMNALATAVQKAKSL